MGGGAGLRWWEGGYTGSYDPLEDSGEEKEEDEG